MAVPTTTKAVFCKMFNMIVDKLVEVCENKRKSVLIDLARIVAGFKLPRNFF
jgi:hypothetical protein